MIAGDIVVNLIVTGLMVISFFMGVFAGKAINKDDDDNYRY